MENSALSSAKGVCKTQGILKFIFCSNLENSENNENLLENLQNEECIILRNT